MKFEEVEYYGLSLPNHGVISYYKWKDLALAKRDAKKVADGLHENVKILIIKGDQTNLIETIRPKTEPAVIDDYEYRGKCNWEFMKHKQ